MRYNIVVMLLLILISCQSCWQNSNYLFSDNWMEYEKGLALGKFKLFIPKENGDSSVVIIIRIDPAYFDFGLFCESEYGPKKRNVKKWVEDCNLIGGINGGMYEADYSTGSGYLKNFNHINNNDYREDWNMFFVCNPVNDSLPEAQLIDLDEKNAEKLISQYNSILQSIRMVATESRNVWTNNTSEWSEAALGEDEYGNILFIYCSSSYIIKELVNELLKRPIKLNKMMHLEGNVQSLYLKYGNMCLAKSGSSELISDSRFYTLMPNMIGFKKRIKVK